MATGVAVPPDKQRITQVESCSGTATESVAVAVGERMSATTFPGQLDGCSSVAAAVCAEAVAEQEPGLQIVRKGRAGSAISTCSVGAPGGSSGASTATGERDGSVSVIAHSQGENSSFYDGVGPSRGPVGPDQGGQNCSVAAVLKRQALLAAIGLQHSPKSDRLYLQSHACAILHFIALFMSFVMLVTLWGILDVAVEILAGPNSVDQLQGYSVMLAVGLLLTIVLKLVENQGLKLTVYPTLIVSLITVVAAWGIIDGLVEVGALGSKHCEGLIYALFFIVAAALVSLHTCFCNRSFSTQLHRFVCY
ncbi:hypothetical protein, conserved [Eimeria necatrix]|uniref:Uncharacterized protein n=1 Tax=Eimeria necatrix TaxID=51315 RepID=U6MKZ4_9EIME|nr:hypothetical protein, conserved [Eimeria necatrix]CDJ64676.1 hypothetical protein, conserved [Eimeria necatrix]